MPNDPDLDPRIVAVVDLVQRTGALDCQIRFSDDEKPVVWLAVATYAEGRAEAAAAMTPGGACWRLGEQLIDGGTCTHCRRPTYLADPSEDGLSALLPPSMGAGCQYTLRGNRIVRGCER